jgi:hypothetical protein
MRPQTARAALARSCARKPRGRRRPDPLAGVGEGEIVPMSMFPRRRVYHRSDGELVTNRRRHRRHKEARLNFNPQLLFSINWATSGPGFEWPEAYYVTYVPGLEK